MPAPHKPTEHPQLPAAKAECKKAMVAVVAESKKVFASEQFAGEPADNSVCSHHCAMQANRIQALLEPLLSDPINSGPLRAHKRTQPTEETETVWQSLRGSPGQTWRVRNDSKVKQMIVRDGVMPCENILCHMVRGDMLTQATPLQVVLSGQGDTKVLRMAIQPSGWITLAIRGAQNYEFLETCNMANTADMFVRQHSIELVSGCRTDEDEWCPAAPFSFAKAASQGDSGALAAPLLLLNLSTYIARIEQQRKADVEAHARLIKNIDGELQRVEAMLGIVQRRLDFVRAHNPC